MARISLQSAINSSFIKSLSSYASSADRGISSNGLTQGTSSTVDLSTTLRIGTRAYSASYDALNTGLSFLNISRSALSELSEITERLIGIAEKASKSGIGQQTREKLSLDFANAGRDFEKVLDNTKFGSRDAFSVDDYTAVFTALGLESDKSHGLANLLGKFSTDSESILADPAVKASSSYRIPNSAYHIGQEKTIITATSAVIPGVVTPTLAELTGVNLVEQDGSGLHTTNTTDQVTGRLLPGLTTNIGAVLSVDESSGYSLFVSTDDLLGFNAGNYSQVFLADEFGNLLQQVTDFSSAVVIGDASSSSDSKTVALSYYDGINANLSTFTIGSFGSDPSTITETTILSEATGGATSVYTNVVVNNSGSTVAFHGGPTAATNQLMYASTAGGGVTTASTAGAVGAGGMSFDFYDSGNLAVFYNKNTGLSNYSVGYVGTSGDVTVTDVSALTGAYSSSAFAVVEGAQRVAAANGTHVGIATLGDVNIAAAYSQVGTIYNAPAGVTSIVNLYAATNADTGLTDLGVYATTTVGFASGRVYNNTGGAYDPDSASTYITDTLSTSGQMSGISSQFSVLRMTESRYNPGLNSLVTFGEGTFTTNSLDFSILGNSRLLTTDSDSGFSIIASNENFLGYNSAGADQLYLVDELGRAVKQLTNTGAATGTVYVDATYDDATKTFLYAATDTSLGSTQLQVKTGSFSNYNATNADVSEKSLYASQTYTSIKSLSLSANASQAAFVAASNSSTYDSGLYNILAASPIEDTSFTALGSEYRQVGFIGNNTLAVVKQDGLTQDLITYQYGSGSEGDALLAGLTGVGAFKTDTDGSSYKIALQDEAESTLYYLNEDVASGVEPYRLRYNTLTDSIKSISIPGMGAGSEGFALSGSASSIGGSGSTETLAFSPSEVQQSGTTLSTARARYDSVVDAGASIRKRPGAFQVLGDLKALKTQLDSNIQAIDDITAYVSDNIKLVRGAADAFISLTNQISSISSAEQLAQKLRTEILRNAPGALSQAENLQTLAVAALTASYSDAFS